MADTHHPRHWRLCTSPGRWFAALCVAGMSATASPPPDIPGEDITQTVSHAAVPSDSLRDNPPETSPTSLSWFDQAVKTWDAPPLSQQMTEDQRIVPLGMASIYVPTFTKSNLEPDVEILDSVGKVAGSGKNGRSYPVLPGIYYVMLGSGSHKQRIVRPVSAEEGRRTPVIPTWAGLMIDVVNENNLLFKGQYELTRIDEFEAFGRGYGRDPTLGEDLKTWVLKPGVYKISTVGEGYNSLANFITVRLLPGELTRVLLVETDPYMKIISGGTVDFSPTRSATQHWTYRVDVGGNIRLDASNNRLDDSVSYITTAALLLNSVEIYKRGPIDWTTSLLLNEGVNLEGLKFKELVNSKDLLRLQSLYVWRFLTWFGPYGRFLLETGIFPKYARFLENEPIHYLVYLNPDNTLLSVDSVGTSRRTEPSFSPLQIEAGLGANADVFSFRFLETRFRAGFGLKRVSAWGQYLTPDPTEIVNSDSIAKAVLDSSYSHAIVLQKVVGSPPLEYGPEAALSIFLRLAQMATVEGEIRIFLPLDRLGTPDLNLTSTVSWRLTRSITVDYEYEYAYSLPKEDKARQKNLSSHTVNVRFSFSKR